MIYRHIRWRNSFEMARPLMFGSDKNGSIPAIRTSGSCIVAWPLVIANSSRVAALRNGYWAHLFATTTIGNAREGEKQRKGIAASSAWIMLQCALLAQALSSQKVHSGKGSFKVPSCSGLARIRMNLNISTGRHCKLLRLLYGKVPGLGKDR